MTDCCTLQVFCWIASRKQSITSKEFSLLTVRRSGTRRPFFGLGSSSSFHWDGWIWFRHTSMFCYDPLEQILMLLMSFNSTRATFMRWFFWLKLSNFGTHYAATHPTCLVYANWKANILSTFSNSSSTILHNNFRHCFNVFVSCWRAPASRVNHRP